jgi:predicted GH43/DUF377 family glycosyl hydrolase
MKARCEPEATPGPYPPHDTRTNRVPGVLPRTRLGLAFSDDGIRWGVQPQPVLDQIDWPDRQVIRAYDPRLTVLGVRCVMCFALDTAHGIRGGIVATDDFERWEILTRASRQAPVAEKIVSISIRSHSRSVCAAGFA